VEEPRLVLRVSDCVSEEILEIADLDLAVLASNREPPADCDTIPAPSPKPPAISNMSFDFLRLQLVTERFLPATAGPLADFSENVALIRQGGPSREGRPDLESNRDRTEWIRANPGEVWPDLPSPQALDAFE
jgi:hypothetical protein